MPPHLGPLAMVSREIRWTLAVIYDSIPIMGNGAAGDGGPAMEQGLLLGVWQEACRHIEISESTANIAAMLVRHVPVEQVLVRRVDRVRSGLETVAIGLSRRGRPTPASIVPPPNWNRCWRGVAGGGLPGGADRGRGVGARRLRSGGRAVKTGSRRPPRRCSDWPVGRSGGSLRRVDLPGAVGLSLRAAPRRVGAIAPRAVFGSLGEQPAAAGNDRLARGRGGRQAIVADPIGPHGHWRPDRGHGRRPQGRDGARGTGRPLGCARADLRRDGHRQGVDRADDPQPLVAPQRAVRPGQLRRNPPGADRLAIVRSQAGRVHRRGRGPAGLVRGPTAARCSSTRSASCRRRPRCGCCASCRTGGWSAWERKSRSTSTSGSWPPRTATWRRWWPRDRFARTCGIGSPCFPSCCRR